jgi:LysR family transcriptional regulator for bpeEF and oprC
MDRLHGINVFLRIVEVGTISGTARDLGVSTAAISASLARLETNLAVRLLDRTTRRLSVTAEGAEFYDRCKKLMSDLDEAEQSISRIGRDPRGKLRVGMPSGLCRMWIVPSLPRFLKKYPEVHLEIVCSDYVPYTIDNGLDASIQVGELHSSRLAMRQLASVDYVVVAAPSYLKKRGVPKVPNDLLQHHCLTYRRPRNGLIREWRFVENGQEQHFAIDGLLTFNSGEALVSAATSGLGLIQVAEFYASQMIATGQLVKVLESSRAKGYDISVVFPQLKNVPPKLRVWIDFLVEIFAEVSWQRKS